jgi:hypothetical protein
MNMIENAGIIGVTRVILVTSIGAGDSKDAIPAKAYDALKDFLVRPFHRPAIRMRVQRHRCRNAR